MDEIDPLIRQEFERLGLNIVENEGLADLIIERVRRDRMKRALVIIVGVVIAALLVIVAGVAITHSIKNSSVATGVSNSFTQAAKADGSLALPQAGYVEVSGAQTVSYTFDLSQGWILQSITQSPNPSMGQVGTVEVYLLAKGEPDRKINEYMMSSFAQVNEFGVPQTGQYRFDYKFTDNTFKGRVRIAIVRSQ